MYTITVYLLNVLLTFIDAPADDRRKLAGRYLAIYFVTVLNYWSELKQ